ncbi:MAG: hypothetical protein CL902_11680 [Dehalococcoidia bacterium]|nr:hypothetical protein [Dehalococcoidia bacterium]
MWWKLPLILNIALVLAIACTTTVEVTSTPTETKTPAPVSDEPTPRPSQESSTTTTTTTTTTINGGVTPEPIGGTPETDRNLRPIPNSGDSSVSRIPDTPTPTPDQILPKDTLGLILAVSGGSSNGTVKKLVTAPGTSAVTGTAFIGLESTSKSVVLFRADTGDATVIDSYTSPSYAPHFKRPYTVDDRLYVSNKFTNGGAMSITEYDTDDFSRESEWGTQQDAIDPGYAVAGDKVYFKTGSTEQWSMSRGFYNEPGDHMNSPFDSRWDTNEMAKPELGFAWVSGGDALYGAKLPSKSNPLTGVFDVDPVTGQPDDYYLTAFEIEDWDTSHPSNWRNVVISDGFAYWAGFVEGSGGYKIEILAASLVNPDVFTVYEFDMPSSAAEVTGFNSTIDADSGYILIKPFYAGGDRSKVLIYDTLNETAEIVDTGFHIVDAQLLFIDG